jgi:L-ribulose-5-phosphate 4-epimerase
MKSRSATLTELRREAYEANMELPRHGLIHLNFGNASALDRARGVMAIKPSGVAYDRLRPADMVLVDLEGGRARGGLRPSSDAPTHLELYRGFPHARGIVHTHSLYATAFAQAGRPVPVLGTTHADFFRGAIPVTRALAKGEILGPYETETGRVILERFSRLNAEEIPGVLVAHHGPFAWGPTAAEAVENAVAIELCARLASLTLHLKPAGPGIPPALLDRHFRRKHGPTAYYGQR